MTWLADGERNNRFYYVSTVQRIRRNIINLIKSNNGEWIKDRDEINKIFKDWHTIFYTTDVKVEE